jgi:NhaP-type Na+/H+ or K+/H+ antiporter
MAAGGLTSAVTLTDWIAVTVVWKLLAGAGVGFLVGRAFAFLLFHNARAGGIRFGDGLVALAATLLAYTATELAHGYGFLAVFVCALTIRAGERDHDFHQEMHDFSDQIERLLMMLLLVLFGGALANGLLSALTWTDALIGLAVVFVVRPVAGLIALLGSRQPMRERLLLAFLGIRGVGSVYYIAWGLNHGDFGDSERLWAVVGFIILVSILVHGVTAAPLLERLARRRGSFPAAPAPANPPGSEHGD